MHFPITEGIVARKLVGEVKAIDGIDFAVHRGETLGLVGESGCGKTTTGRCILRLERPTAGEIRYDGVDIARMQRKELLALRRRIQVIFQDPVQLAEPTHEGGRYPRRAYQGAWHRAGCGEAFARGCASCCRYAG